jgi:hypothetical protein
VDDATENSLGAIEAAADEGNPGQQSIMWNDVIPSWLDGCMSYFNQDVDVPSQFIELYVLNDRPDKFDAVFDLMAEADAVIEDGWWTDGG